MRDDYVWCYSAEGFHKVYYRQWGESNGNNVIVCCHGVMRNLHDFDYIGKTLADQGYCAVCPDVVGRGESDHFRDAKNYSYYQYILDITAIVAKVGAKTVDWLGTSMGGLMGMMIASQPNTIIRRLIMNDIGPIVLLAALKRIQAYAGKEAYFNNFDEACQAMRKNYAPFGIKNDEHWMHIFKHTVKQLQDGRWTIKADSRCMTQGLDPSHQESDALPDIDEDGNIIFWKYWEKISCPVLLTHGANSDLVTAEVVKTMKQYPIQLESYSFQDVGHAPALMEPDQISIITAWLKKTTF
ncbi:Protein ABHD11 [Trichoplax sp. H2]|nr:Protein ABHD11 [Trichoplax sp. H2]|eukprot:RDD43736.1 Protein ABHD11 [Trichoplax sp. H2]